MPNIKALGLQISKKKNFEVGLLCFYVLTCDPHLLGPVLTPGVHMNKLGRGLQRDATFQISKPSVFKYERRRILKFAFFVPIF